MRHFTSPSGARGQDGTVGTDRVGVGMTSWNGPRAPALSACRSIAPTTRERLQSAWGQQETTEPSATSGLPFVGSLVLKPIVGRRS
jgi:hypothetical protein